jgi:lipopolysaccharide/colanic/teichoic acid biosynthesis glycosyltransferase
MDSDFVRSDAPTEPLRGISGPSTRREAQPAPRPARPAEWAPGLVLPCVTFAAAGVAAATAGGAVLPSVVYAALLLAGIQAAGLNRLRICLRVADQAYPVIAAVAISALVMLPWLHPRAAIKLGVISAALVLASRAMACAALAAAHRRGRLMQATVIVGAGTTGAHLCELMLAHPEFGLRPVGFVEHGPARRDLSLPYLGAPEHLALIVARYRIRRVVVSYTSGKDEDLVAALRSDKMQAADVCVVPRLYEIGAGIPRGYLDEIWGIPLLPLRRRGTRRAAMLAKRSVDIAASALLLVLAAPVLLALAVVIRLWTDHDPIFRQARVTGQGREASVLKLRTLPASAAGNPDTSWGIGVQPSSPLCGWLRATHLDELPQLVNVLRGEMSLVGPRPERPYFATKFGRDIQRYDDRGRMPAGITGWAQVHGLHGDTSIAERARFDNQYIEYWSLWLDLTILARTTGGLIRRPRRP